MPVIYLIYTIVFQAILFLLFLGGTIVARFILSLQYHPTHSDIFLLKLTQDGAILMAGMMLTDVIYASSDVVRLRPRNLHPAYYALFWTVIALTVTYGMVREQALALALIYTETAIAFLIWVPWRWRDHRRRNDSDDPRVPPPWGDGPPGFQIHFPPLLVRVGGSDRDPGSVIPEPSKN